MSEEKPKLELDQTINLVVSKKNILEGLYVILSADQLPDGTWGYSIPINEQPDFTHEKIKGSPTVSASAAIALTLFTQDNKHLAVSNFVKHINNAYDEQTGAFGRKAIYTSDPDIQSNALVVPNCRHTARFLWALMSLFRFSKQVIDGISFLINNQKNDGWSINPDNLQQSADPLTVAYVVETLNLSIKLGIDNLLSPKDYRRVTIASMRGISWLAENYDEGFWAFRPNSPKKFQYTAMVLSSVPELAIQHPDIYSQSINKMLDIARGNNLLFTTPKTGTIDFTATSLFWSVIAETPGFEQIANQMLSNLFTAFEDQRNLISSQTSDWAFFLYWLLRRFDNYCVLQPERRIVLDKLIDSIKIKIQNISLKELQSLFPNELRWVAPVIFTNVSQNQGHETYHDALLNLKADLIAQLKQEKQKLIKSISLENSELEEYITTKINPKDGVQTGKKVLNRGKAIIEAKIKKIDETYHTLLSRIENSTSVEELAEVKELIEKGII